MYKESLKTEYTLRNITVTMRNRFRDAEHISIYLYWDCDIKVGKDIKMIIIKNYTYGSIVFLYNYRYQRGKFLFIYTKDLEFLLKDSKSSKPKDFYINQWRNLGDYKEVIKEFVPPEFVHEENLKELKTLEYRIESLKYEIQKHIDKIT